MKIGIIGAGGMGGVHGRHYRNHGVESGVFDVDVARADAVCSNFGARRFDSFEEICAWSDALDVCVPNDYHAVIVGQCLDAKKPTLVEKPIANDLATACQLVEKAERIGVPLCVGQVVRFFSEYRRANQLVKDGKLGHIAAVRMRRGGGPPKAPWFLDHSRSGGVIVDLAVHEFDWLLWTLGPVSHVYARSVGARDGNGPDYGLTTLSFDCGAVAHVEATWMDPSGFRTEFEVCGSEGMIQHDSRQASSLVSHLGGQAQYAGPMAVSDDPFYRQLGEFVKAAQGEANTAVTGREGLNALSVAVAARESSLGGTVVIPERF